MPTETTFGDLIATLFAAAQQEHGDEHRASEQVAIDLTNLLDEPTTFMSPTLANLLDESAREEPIISFEGFHMTQ